MHPVEVDECLEQMQLIVDTREQPTQQFKRRIEAAALPYKRQKLNAGDYSCTCPMPDGSSMDLSDKVVIERKMSIDELAMCFGTERKRFTAEFDRAAEAGTKIYLIVEGATWEKILAHKYRSKLNEKALLGSILAFEARYNAPVIFCQKETSGRLIREILMRELKERLRAYGE